MAVSLETAFLDESCFYLKNADGQLRVRHRRGKRYFNDCCTYISLGWKARYGIGAYQLPSHDYSQKVNAQYYRIFQNYLFLPFFCEYLDLHTYNHI